LLNITLGMPKPHNPLLGYQGVGNISFHPFLSLPFTPSWSGGAHHARPEANGVQVVGLDSLISIQVSSMCPLDDLWVFFTPPRTVATSKAIYGAVRAEGILTGTAALAASLSPPAEPCAACSAIVVQQWRMYSRTVITSVAWLQVSGLTDKGTLV
jgi:hypothetical protein